MRLLRKLIYPEVYQGRNKKIHYFEGWYFKHTSKDMKINFSIIPGVSFEKEKNHAFIQVIIGPPFKSYCIPFKIEDFSYSDEPFKILIGKNTFGLTGITLDIDAEKLRLKGEIDYNKISRIRKTILQPNIMGFFAYFGFMQCNHGVISLGHELDGCIEVDGKQKNFTGGNGYIEKDWGNSFPKKYIWVQCNNFAENISLFASVAHIPFLGREFIGFISILKIEGEEYKFATYNGTKLLRANTEDDLVKIIFSKKKTRLEIIAKIKEGLVLKAPKEGVMENEITETLEGVVEISLYENEKLIKKAIGTNAGVETVSFDNHTKDD